jgi:hypothetical protein
MYKILLTALALGCFGCRPTPETASPGTKELTDRLAAQEQRLAQLEVDTRVLKAKLEEKVRPITITNALPLIAPAEPAVSARLDAVVASEVARQVENKIGSDQDVETIFRQAVEEQMAAYDKRQRDAREEELRKQRAEAEVQRIAAEKQRAEAEEKRWAQVQGDLGLNESQTAQLREMSQQTRQAIREAFDTMRAQGDFSPAQAHQQAEAVRTNYEAQLSQILTAEQLEAYHNEPHNVLRMMDGVGGLGRFGRRGRDVTAP